MASTASRESATSLKGKIQERYGIKKDRVRRAVDLAIEIAVRQLRETSADQEEFLLGFGDGYVEIDNIKTAGGPAIAVASDEKDKSGRPDPWKRDRLIGVGADVVVPDYRDARVLLDYLWRT